MRISCPGRFASLVWALVLGLGLISPAEDAWGCNKLGNWELGIAGSYESGKQSVSGRRKEFQVTNCRKNVGEYLVLTTAPVFLDLSMRGLSTVEGELPQDSCYLDQSPFEVSRPAEVGIEEHYRKEVRFLNHCLELEVADSRGEIDTAVQLNCEITPLGPGKVRARGPQCVFRIAPGSDFTVRYALNPACLNRENLQTWGDLEPMDVKTSLGFYRTSNLTPGSPEYAVLGFVDARVSLQPDSRLLPVSTYFGRETSNWPTQYGAQVSLGKVTLLKRQRPGAPSYFLRVPFLVNNNCPARCREGLCASPCDFYVPVAAKFTLAKKAGTDAKEEGQARENFRPLDWWYQGNIVPGRFLGELSLGKEIRGDEPRVNDRYRITAEFSDPSLSYRVLVDQAKQLLIKLGNGTIPLGNAGTGELEPLRALLGTIAGPESLPEIRELGEGSLDPQPVLDLLNNLVGVEETWPPYYSEVVSGESKDSAKRVYQVLMLSFRVAAITPSGAIGIDQISLKRISRVFGDFERAVPIQPQIKCGG